MPLPVAAHAIGGTFQLPVPLWLYLAGAGTAVAASFVVTTLTARTPARDPRTARGRCRRPRRRRAGVLARAGTAWWYGAIAVGSVVGDISPLPAVLLWICIWVGLPIVAVPPATRGRR